MKKRLSLILLASVVVQIGLIPAECQTPKPAPAGAEPSLQNIRLLQKLEIEVIRQEGEIQKGIQVGQIYNALIKDLAGVAISAKGEVKDDKMQKLLAENGVTINIPNTNASFPSVATPTPKPVDMPADDPAKYAPVGTIPQDMREDFDYMEQVRKANVKAIQQSKTLQAALEKLVNDVLELSKTDADAKALVEKYHIKKNTPAP